jgi:hypothetical protein
MDSRCVVIARYRQGEWSGNSWGFSRGKVISGVGHHTLWIAKERYSSTLIEGSVPASLATVGREKELLGGALAAKAEPPAQKHKKDVDVIKSAIKEARQQEEQRKADAIAKLLTHRREQGRKGESLK